MTAPRFKVGDRVYKVIENDSWFHGNCGRVVRVFYFEDFYSTPTFLRSEYKVTDTDIWRYSVEAYPGSARQSIAEEKLILEEEYAALKALEALNTSKG